MLTLLVALGLYLKLFNKNIRIIDISFEIIKYFAPSPAREGSQQLERISQIRWQG